MTDPDDVRHAIFDAIDNHPDDPAPVAAVVDDVLSNGYASPTATFDAFAALFKHGDVYEPTTGHVRRTDAGE